MKPIRLLALVLAVLLFGGVAVSASDMPYASYTFDEWKNPIESPSGYEPLRYVEGTALGVGTMVTPKDLFVWNNEKVFVLDSGNGRILVLDDTLRLLRTLDTFTAPDGSASPLKDPEGLFVSDDGTIYIADTGNERLLACDANGGILLSITKPATDIFPQDKAFAPQKLVVDGTGTIFAVCKSIVYGAVVFKPDGSFSGYFGSNKVEATVDLLMDRFWKSLLSKTQKDKLPNYIPIEYTNIDIDAENFIYSCTVNAGTAANMVRKINPKGINILEGKVANSFQKGFGDLQPVWFKGQRVATSLIDVCIDDDGYITALDFTRGRLFQYDQDANLLFAFGGLGTQLGMFRSPIAIDHLGDTLLVLDQNAAGITEFGLTEFGRTVHEAIQLYNDGRYAEAVAPWREVLRYDTNFNMAYVGIGKALLEAGDNSGAMANFLVGHFSTGYNQAYGEFRTDRMRNDFGWYFAGILLLIFLIYGRRIPFVATALSLPGTLLKRVRASLRRNPNGRKEGNRS
jgi:hypothetical protein